MKYKVGDKVRIQSQEWIDVQERDKHGNISLSVGRKQRFSFIAEMEEYAGKEARILRTVSNATDGWYKLDIDNRFYNWQDWMFDPGYRDDEPLPAEDAIRAMMDGKTLYNEHGTRYWFTNGHFSWEAEDGCGGEQVKKFDGLYCRLPKRKRPMTRFEVLNWVSSEASHGWVVRKSDKEEWYAPSFHVYPKEGIPALQRARILPDGSGIDESTIQGFEVEE
jgi:hypothetical protein